MSIKMTQQELRDLGLQIDPDNPTQAIPVEPQSELVPDESWDLDRLGIYAATGLSEASRLEREFIQLGRRSTIQIFRAGRALSIAERKVKWGEWGRWLVEHNIKRTTAWEAIQLYERAGSEEAIANLTPSQAKRRCGIGSPPRADTEESAESENHNGKTYHYKPKPAVSVENPQEAKDQVTKTGNKVATPEVGVSLNASELLGKAYSLLIEAEKLGITPDCIDILNKIFLKTTALVANVGASS